VSTLRKLSHFKTGPYLFGLLAMLVPAAMQFALFIFLARVLGVGQYGLYLALLSWSPLCFELVGWGAGEYLLRRTSQDRAAFAATRGHMRAAFWLSLPLATLVFAALTLGAVSQALSFLVVATIGLAEFTGLRLLVNAEQMFIALGRMGGANWLRSSQVAPRIAGVAISYFALGGTSFEALALGGSLGMLAGGLAAAWATRALPIGTKPNLLADGTRQGTWFMGTQLVRAGQHNIDRIVLAPLVDPATLGLYGAAQRFIQIGLLPLQSILRLTYPGFFKAGTGGLGATLRFGLAVLPLALAASAVTALAIAGAASWLPLVVGPEFEQSVIYLLYLAPILPLFAINAVLSDTLSGAGFLPLRLVLTAVGVIAQALMFWLLHDALQIVLASYAGVGLSCALMGGAVMLLRRSEVLKTRAMAAST